MAVGVLGPAAQAAKLNPVQQCPDEAARLAVEGPGGQQGTVLGGVFVKTYLFLPCEARKDALMGRAISLPNLGKYLSTFSAHASENPNKTTITAYQQLLRERYDMAV